MAVRAKIIGNEQKHIVLLRRGSAGKKSEKAGEEFHGSELNSPEMNSGRIFR